MTLEQLAQRISADDARRALRATQATLKLLTTNTNPRLALEVMFLDYPGLR